MILADICCLVYNMTDLKRSEISPNAVNHRFELQCMWKDW